MARILLGFSMVHLLAPTYAASYRRKLVTEGIGKAAYRGVA